MGLRVLPASVAQKLISPLSSIRRIVMPSVKLEATAARTHGEAAVWVPLPLSDRFYTPTLIRQDNERGEKAHVFEIEAEHGACRHLVRAGP